MPRIIPLRKSHLNNLFSRVVGFYFRQIKGVDLADNSIFFGGVPLIDRCQDSKIIIGSQCKFLSDTHFNLAGINHLTIIATRTPGSSIIIGEHCGFSGVTLIASQKIEIGNYVNFGVNSCVYDTDFHVIDPFQRRVQKDIGDACKSPVKIGDDVWVAANVLILKGVSIGNRSIIGAGSVVTHDVPDDCIYAGNPAKFIRRISNSNTDLQN